MERARTWPPRANRPHISAVGSVEGRALARSSDDGVGRGGAASSGFQVEHPRQARDIGHDESTAQTPDVTIVLERGQ